MTETIKLFYDDDCSFCTKSVTFLIKYFKLSESILFKGSSDYLIKKYMEEVNSWVLIDNKGNKWIKFSVFQQLIKISPRFQWTYSFFSMRIVSYLGDWIYLIVSNNRGYMSKIFK